MNRIHIYLRIVWRVLLIWLLILRTCILMLHGLFNSLKEQNLNSITMNVCNILFLRHLVNLFVLLSKTYSKILNKYNTLKSSLQYQQQQPQRQSQSQSQSQPQQPQQQLLAEYEVGFKVLFHISKWISYQFYISSESCNSTRITQWLSYKQ